MTAVWLSCSRMVVLTRRLRVVGATSWSPLVRVMRPCVTRLTSCSTSRRSEPSSLMRGVILSFTPTSL